PLHRSGGGGGRLARRVAPRRLRHQLLPRARSSARAGCLREGSDGRAVRQSHRLLERRSEEHTSELQSPCNLVCRLLLGKKKTIHRFPFPISTTPSAWSAFRSISAPASSIRSKPSRSDLTFRSSISPSLPLREFRCLPT